ncbi:hypothetical protein L596_001286 [Steinernema carpocapsae]|uniref:Uncharacterized protein n=1 Tax=Steinernema carpocapsae TaxID=34508 RepID=A0A4U8UKL0_STECR|nr:hypothetical protein L596_001286 [Steinernema carpocapsae]
MPVFQQDHKQDHQPEYFIVGEPTELKFDLLQKAVVKLTKANAKAAQSGFPEMGVSAVKKLFDILDDLRFYYWPSEENRRAEMESLRSKELKSSFLGFSIFHLSGFGAWTSQGQR